MREADILVGLTEIVRNVLDDDTITLSEETIADDIDGWDSFNHINILVAAEHRFSVKFRTAEIEGLKNVGQFVHLIAQKTPGNPQL